MIRDQDETQFKYVIYARRSIEQRSGEERVESIEDQLRSMREVAAKYNLKVVRTFFEDKSAAKPGARVAFREMVEFIEAKKANAILCWDYDRIARNPKETGEVQQLMQDKLLLLIRTPSRDYTQQDNYRTAMEGVANSEYVEKLKVNIKRGQEGAVLRGFRPCLAPYGYENTKYRDGRHEQCLRKEPEATLVRRMFDLILSRQYTPHQVFDIAVNDWGLRARKYKRNPNRNPLSIHGFYNILKNPFYYGEFKYPQKDELNAKWYKGAYEPIISRAEFDEVQRILGKKGAQIDKHIHAYVGLMRCGGCGARITCEKKIKRQQNGNIHEYSYYRCTGQIDKSCKQKAVEVKKLEEVFVDFLASLEIAPQFHEWAMAELKNEYLKETTDKKSILYSREERCREITKLKDNLFELRLSGDVDSDNYKKRRERYEEEERSLKGDIEAVESRFKTWIDDAERLLTFAEKAKDEFLNGSLQKRRSIIAALGNEHILDQGVITMQLEKPFEVLIEGSQLSLLPAEIIEPPNSEEEYTQKGTFVPSSEMRWRWGF